MHSYSVIQDSFKMHIATVSFKMCNFLWWAVCFKIQMLHFHSDHNTFIQDVQFSLKSIQDYSFKIQDFDGCINMHNFR